MRLFSSVMFLFSPSFSLPFSKCSFLQNSSGSVVSVSSTSTQTSSREHRAFWVGGSLGLVFSMWLGSTLISMGSKFVLFTISAISGGLLVLRKFPLLRDFVRVVTRGLFHFRRRANRIPHRRQPSTWAYCFRTISSGFSNYTVSFFLLNNFDMKCQFFFSLNWASFLSFTPRGYTPFWV